MEFEVRVLGQAEQGDDRDPGPEVGGQPGDEERQHVGAEGVADQEEAPACPDAVVALEDPREVGRRRPASAASSSTQAAPADHRDAARRQARGSVSISAHPPSPVSTARGSCRARGGNLDEGGAVRLCGRRTRAAEGAAGAKERSRRDDTAVRLDELGHPARRHGEAVTDASGSATIRPSPTFSRSGRSRGLADLVDLTLEDDPRHAHPREGVEVGSRALRLRAGVEPAAAAQRRVQRHVGAEAEADRPPEGLGGAWASTA